MTSPTLSNRDTLRAQVPDMVNMTIAIPILHRAHRVRPVVESCVAATPYPAASPGLDIVFAVTPGDDAVFAAVEAVSAEYPGYVHHYLTVPWPADGRGDYARKINAIWRATDRAWLFMGADDLEFRPGWIEAAMSAAGPDCPPGVTPGVIGTNDLGNPRVLAGVHSTHSIINRDWARQHPVPGGRSPQVLCEEYWHEGVDDELVGWATSHHSMIFAPGCVVRHRHPNWDASVPTDDMYRQQPGRMRDGRRVLARRRKLWT